MLYKFMPAYRVGSASAITSPDSADRGGGDEEMDEEMMAIFGAHPTKKPRRDEGLSHSSLFPMCMCCVLCGYLKKAQVP
jgi:hypothetical protein